MIKRTFALLWAVPATILMLVAMVVIFIVGLSYWVVTGRRVVDPLMDLAFRITGLGWVFDRFIERAE